MSTAATRAPFLTDAVDSNKLSESLGNTAMAAPCGPTRPTPEGVSLALTSGGQTLFTAEALTDLSATDPGVESHGHWRMKGVRDPIKLFEIGNNDAPFTLTSHRCTGPLACLRNTQNPMSSQRS